MTLADFLRQTAAAQLGTDASSAAVDRLAAAAAELLTGYGVCSAAPAERYSVGMLDRGSYFPSLTSAAKGSLW